METSQIKPINFTAIINHNGRKERVMLTLESKLSNSVESILATAEDAVHQQCGGKISFTQWVLLNTEEPWARNYAEFFTLDELNTVAKNPAVLIMFGK